MINVFSQSENTFIIWNIIIRNSYGWSLIAKAEFVHTICILKIRCQTDVSHWPITYEDNITLTTTHNNIDNKGTYITIPTHHPRLDQSQKTLYLTSDPAKYNNRLNWQINNYTRHAHTSKILDPTQILNSHK